MGYYYHVSLIIKKTVVKDKENNDRCRPVYFKKGKLTKRNFPILNNPCGHWTRDF